MSLVFSDTSTKQGLIQYCESTLFGDNNYGTISGNTNLLATFTRLLNEGLNRVTSLILQADGRWQFDDTAFTDYPIATTTLVTTSGSEQQDYTFDITHLRITRVEVKDVNGNWKLLEPIDQADIYNQSLTDFLKTAGLPMYYDKIANSIFLYPKPLATAVTATNGLKVYFQRPPSYFTSSDTTKVPGFNSLYHKLIGLIACREYALDRGLAAKDNLTQRVVEGEQDLQDNYSLRNKDEKIQVRVRRVNYR